MKRRLYNRRYVKFIAINFALLIFFDAISPFKLVFALTSGPVSPEFSSFEPVATTDMVNVFTGDFTYNLPIINIPGPDNSGYPLSLSYHSGASVEEEASWVGFGWTLNPGSITRGKRGLPDDFQGNIIKQYNKTRPNFSVSGTGNFNIELFSNDLKSDPDRQSILSAGISNTIRYNNYQGMSLTRGYNVGIKGIVNLGMSVRGTERTYSASVNPTQILCNYLDKKAKAALEGKTEFKKKYSRLRGTLMKAVNSSPMAGVNNFTSTYGIYSMVTAPPVTVLNSFEGISYNYSVSAQINPSTLPIGFQGGLGGNLTLQNNEQDQENLSYGYMYQTESNPEGGKVAKDYYVEKGSTYSELDNFLGIPFNSADNYLLSGEGLGGGFRMYHNRVLRHTPTQVKSEKEIRQIGLEVMAGANFGIGCDFGVGKNTLTSESWDFPGTIGNTEPDEFIFRFNNDMGGVVSYSDNTNAETAELITPNDVNVIGFKDFKPVGIELTDHSNDVEWKKTSSHIAYSLSGGQHFNKSQNIKDLLYNIRNISSIDASLSEFSITNADGFNYLYGLPVYTKEERNVQLNITSHVSTDNVRDYLVYEEVSENDPAGQETYVGEYIKDPYASSYLLTQITSPDYIDMDNNGPSDKDFGGWTKFDYRKLYGSDSERGFWYNWRIPYNGLYNDKNELSNLEDDLGSFSKGMKEMCFLKAIETKTHVAFFITNTTNGAISFGGYIPEDLPHRNEILQSLNGSGEYRFDALGAAAYASSDPAAKNAAQTTEKLERIVLFSKARFEKPIQTTYFEYNYSLVKNLPNSINGNYPDAQLDESKKEASGKLTLSRVWTESEGIVKSKISPYTFRYAYQANYDERVKSKYHDITTYGIDYSDHAQNPDYCPESLDMWGSINYDGKNRYNKMQPWVYQGKIENLKFDPAAYQLKQIKLPSGGEIHVQYEQNDYASVQDRNPMAMVSLTGTSQIGYNEHPKYRINLEDLGLEEAGDPVLEELRELIEDYYVTRKNKIYFKFLYSLNQQVPGLNTGKAEYIEGYADVESVDFVSSPSDKYIEITLDAGEPDLTTNVCPENPRTLCYNFLTTQRAYKIDFPNNETPYDREILNNYEAYKSQPFKTLGFMTDFMSDQFEPLGVMTKFKNPDKNDVGNQMNLELSYLKIPINQDKRGGGVRVKRLLLYDPGIENGDAALYGNEYIYKTEEGRSSGVATNEPALGREENALVTFLPRLKQSYFKKLVGGRDRKQVEGPIGESILPAPSVGYARVIVQNIHKGVSGTGFTIHEFNTTKDYPFDMVYNSTDDVDRVYDISGKGVDMTDLHDKANYNKRDKLNFNAGLFSYSVNKSWLSQGFRFIVNNMNGQPKSIANYYGTYGENGSIPQNYVLSSKTEYDYFEPGEKVPMWNGVDGIVRQVPGKEMEIAIEQKKMHDETMDISLEIDISVAVGWLPIMPGLGPTFHYSDQAIQTFALSKVMRYPAIVKAVRNYQDGLWSLQENLAFSPYTGSPILNRTIDGYNNQILNSEIHDGSYYSYSIPAAAIYPDMGQKSIDPMYSNQLTSVAGTIVTYGSNPLDNATPQNVVSANATTYKNDWEWSDDILIEYGADLDDINDPNNPFGLNNHYRPYESYIFKTEVSGSNLPGEKIYSGGICMDFSNFNFSNPNEEDGWLKINSVTKYSPQGSPLEEKNVLDIYSAAKYGYNKTMPVALAQNAQRESIFFNDFECDVHADVDQFHSGGKSFKVVDGNYRMINGLKVNQQLWEKGGLVKLWVKTSTENSEIYADINGVSTQMSKVAMSQDWSLYEAKIINWGAINPNTVDIDLVFSSSSDIWLDDIRFQPLDAQMTTYVYDPATLRLLTQFDDQHFGLYYQYNNDGKLVRKMIETERGMKTLQESQYNMPKTPRDLTLQTN